MLSQSLLNIKKDLTDNKIRTVFSFLFLIVAVLLTYLSGIYVDRTKTIAVPDLILDHLPSVNLSIIFIYGLPIVLAIYILYPVIYRHKSINYSVSMLALLITVRAGFITLTHLGTPVDAVNIADPALLSFITYSNDLFFSGHAAIPFLGFLVYRGTKVGWFMLLASVVLAATVLLMHIHYSIDVASAYFITYAVYRAGDRAFAR